MGRLKHRTVLAAPSYTRCRSDSEKRLGVQQAANCTLATIERYCFLFTGSCKSGQSVPSSTTPGDMGTVFGNCDPSESESAARVLRPGLHGL